MRLSAILLIALLAAPALAKQSDEVDYVALASLLARDGEYDRADDALKHVTADTPGIDLVQYHTVRGLVALEKQRLDEAADAFGAAIVAGQADPLVHLYRAQALFGLERYGDAVAALEAAGDAIDGLSGAWLMRANAQWMLGQRQVTFDTLRAAGERFPGNVSFLRRQVFYLIDAGLYQEAAALGRDYLARAEGKAEDYVAIGTALRRGRSFDEALGFLEAAALRFPGDLAVAKVLAQTWVERGDPYAAAEILARVAVREPALNAEAAELFRRAGHGARALTLNARIPDSPRKLKQRVGILIELRRYDQVAGMQDALYRAGLYADEDVRYALAYAHYRAGDHAAAEKHLSALTRADLFRKATELRRLMQECADARWTCV